MADPNTDPTNPAHIQDTMPVDPVTKVQFPTGDGKTGDIYDLTGSQVNNPSLPNGTKVDPVHQTVNPNELITNPNLYTPTTATAGSAVGGVANSNPNAVAAQTNTGQTALAAQEAHSESTYNASQIGDNSPQVNAVLGHVGTLSTVQGQLAQLMNFDPATAPAWAKGASAMANDQLAARGMGASSIAGASITQAIMQAGIPIATQDAQTYAQMDLTNLDNANKAVLQNGQMRLQTMLSDQAASNASKQFNAQNQTQVTQFFADLMAKSDQFNVAQANAMLQTLTTVKSQEAVATAQNQTQASVVNAQNATAISQFNASQANAAQQFYDSNQLIVDQSNAQWRRDTNTSNTVADNNANQVNAANLLSLSNTAMNNIWQATRDNASWVQQSSENSKDRAANLTIAAFNRDTQFNMLNATQQADFFAALGGFGMDLFKHFAFGGSSGSGSP